MSGAQELKTLFMNLHQWKEVNDPYKARQDRMIMELRRERMEFWGNCIWK